MEYLGHIISNEGVEADHGKVKNMLDWLLPKTITQLRGFMGLIGYYKKFVKGYGVLSKQLCKLLQKNFSMDREGFNSF